MRRFQNKKSIAKEQIVWIILLTASFVLIIPVIELFQAKAEAKTTESICRGSVALRERSYKEFYLGPAKMGAVATPLLCRTNDKYLPQNKDATKEQVEKEIADLMAKCWETFGEGRIQDVFKEGDQFYKNCFVCYTVSLRETSDFKGERGTISFAENLQYMFEHPYKSYPESDFCKITGGYCIDSESRDECNKIPASSSYILIDKKSDICQKKNKKACCYTEYGCWNKGGICSDYNPDANRYTAYDSEGWSCPSKMNCFIKKENYYSYGDYIQRYGGPGNMLVLTDLKPGETYAISFGSKTKECGWCKELGRSGAIATALGGVATVITLAATAPVSIPVGIVAGGALLAGGGGAVIGYVGFRGGSELASEAFISKLFERDINTIYLTTLNQIQTGNQCSLVSDIRDK